MADSIKNQINHSLLIKPIFQDNSREWLTPIEKELKFGFKRPFLEATENIIESNQIYRNESKIHEVISHLQTKRICLIRAAEGRGKTYLSHIVAHQLNKINKYKVFFIDLRDSDVRVKNIDSLLNLWGRKQKKYLLVLENAHAFSELDELIAVIENWRTTENCNNLCFLLNARYTVEEFDTLSDWSEDFIVKLTPNIVDIKNIISLYEDVVNKKSQKKRKAISDADFKQFIENKIFNEKGNNNSWKGISANLRLLNIYLNIWQENENIDFITKIDENQIIKKFGEKFRINNLSTLDDKNIVLHLSCIFQFDVPFYVNKDIYKIEYDLLSNLAQQGLLYQKGDYFYLAHSVDAFYLCKAICKILNYDYIEKTSYYVKIYIQRMLDESDPKSFENDFKKLLSGLSSKRELFGFISVELADENDKWLIDIIEKLNSGFVFMFFSFGDSNYVKNKFDFYIKNQAIFKRAILESSTVVCYRLYKVLKKYYSYNFTQDVFEDTNDLSCFLNKAKIPLGKLLSDISKLSFEHKNIVEKYTRKKEEEQQKKEEQQRKYMFYSKIQPITAERIDNKFTRKFYSFEDVSLNISKLLKCGFYFYGLSWKQLGVFTRKISKHYELTNEEKCIQLAEKIVTKILDQKENFKYSTDEELSLFLNNIKSIDKVLFDKVIKEKCVIEDLKKRIQNFSYNDAELYLLSHLTFSEWCVPEINKLITHADERQKLMIIEWYNKVCINNEIDEKSLQWYIKELLLKNNEHCM